MIYGYGNGTEYDVYLSNHSDYSFGDKADLIDVMLWYNDVYTERRLLVRRLLVRRIPMST